MHVSGHFHCFYTTTPGGSGTPTYVYLGSTRDGFHMQYRIHKQPVIDDAFGDGMSDGIQQGADMSLRLTYIEYDKMVSAMGIPTGAFGQANAKVGIPLSSLYGALFLLPVAGTPWATVLGAGNGRLFYSAGLDEDIEVLMASKLAEGPANFTCLPYLVSNVYKFFGDVVSPTLPSYGDYPQ